MAKTSCPTWADGASIQRRWIAGGIELDAVVEALAATPDAALLESSAAGQWGRFSVVAAWPAEVLELRGDVLTSRLDGVVARGAAEVCERLAAALDWRAGEAQAPLALPYGPGWIGYVGYECGSLLERLPSRPGGALPDLRLAFYDAVAVFDAVKRRWQLAWLQRPGYAPPASAARLEALLAGPVGDAVGSMRAGASPVVWPQPAWQSNFTPEQYLRQVRRCLDYIAAGDIYQVNLAQRLTIPAVAPGRLYRCLRRRNPSSHAALMTWRDADSQEMSVISASPELLLRVRDGQAMSRPIKGTRRRSGDAAADERARRQLLASEKDRAELAMIIDLVRNDLGRVCAPGSVAVAGAWELEAHPTVYHTVASVCGRLSPGVSPWAALAALFPGGSITGAPKIRAMEIIAELEDVPRGVYTGSIGYVGPGGLCEWNIAIRTIQQHGGLAHLHVGGGIVADSDPQAEYDETLDKARGLLESAAMATNASPGPIGR